MRPRSSHLGLVFKRIAVAAGIASCASACAPDLTIGVATTTTTTATGGSTTTSTSAGGGGEGGGVAGGSVIWAQYADGGGDSYAYAALPTSIDVLVAGETIDASKTVVATTSSISFGGYNLPMCEGAGHRLRALAAEPNGDMYAVGDLFGTTEFEPGDGSPVSSGGYDCLIAHVTPQFFDLRKIGTGGYSSCAGVAALGPETLHVAGTFSGTLDDVIGSGAGPVVSAGGNDVFVARLDQMGGGADVAWQYGDLGDQHLVAMARDADGTLHLLADDDGPKGHGYSDLWLFSIDADGTLIDEIWYGTGDVESALGLGVGADGSVAIAGALVPFEGASTPIDVGGGALGGIAFLAAFDAKHNHLWSHGIVADPNVLLTIGALLRDANGNTFVGGSFTAEITIAGRTLTALGAEDGFVLKIDPSGDLVWATTLANAQGAAVRALAMDPEGALIVAGDFATELSVDGVSIFESSTGRDFFAMGMQP